MIDIHCHILSGIDDGPKTMEQSLDIAKSLAERGFSHVIATPHSLDGIYNAKPVDILTKTFALNQALHRANVNLTIYPGAEYPLTLELLHAELVTLNKSRYLLIEPPFYQPLPYYSTSLFFQLQARGLTPILAHPERCAEVIDNPKLVRDYVNLGVLMQVTAASFFGRYGKRIKKLVREWSESGLVHFLATDCHQPLSYDLLQLKNSLDEALLDQYTIFNPGAVLHNEAIHHHAS